MLKKWGGLTFFEPPFKNNITAPCVTFNLQYKYTYIYF